MSESDPKQNEMASFGVFQYAFNRVKRAMGLVHYHVQFELASFSHFADIEIDSDECTASVRVNVAKCAEESALESTAIHECLHLLLADFSQACASNPKAIRVEEERIVRRLEPLLSKLLFT